MTRTEKLRSAMPIAVMLPIVMFSANPGLARTLAGQRQDEVKISEKVPSADVASAVSIGLGEVVTGRLADSGQTGKYHYWHVVLPAGKYKVVWDVKRAEETSSNIGGDLQWFSADGQKLEQLLGMNDIAYKARSARRFTVKAPLNLVVRVSIAWAVCDYWMGFFKDSEPIAVPFFVRRPAVPQISLGESRTALLDGSDPRSSDAYYVSNLSAGDYKITLEVKLPSGSSTNIGGNVAVLDENANQQLNSLVGVNDIDVSSRRAAKLSLADEAKLIFRVRVAWIKQYATLTLERWPEN